jgi:hypothetical protein
LKISIYQLILRLENEIDVLVGARSISKKLINEKNHDLAIALSDLLSLKDSISGCTTATSS